VRGRPVAPATGHPAKYYFAGTPEAGAARNKGDPLASSDPGLRAPSKVLLCWDPGRGDALGGAS